MNGITHIMNLERFVAVTNEEVLARLEHALNLADRLGEVITEQSLGVAPIVNASVSAEWVMLQAVQFEVLALQNHLLTMAVKDQEETLIKISGKLGLDR